jgi:yecA family protein
VRFATATEATDPIVNVVADVLKGAPTEPSDSHNEVLAWIEGLLTAAAIGPECVRPSEWMRLVFGRDHVFESVESAQTSMTALGLMYNMILGKREGEGANYGPRFLELAEEGEHATLAVLWTEASSLAWEFTERRCAA